MRKLDIYNGNDDGTTYLRLKRMDGEIRLVACGADGNVLTGGNIARVDENGILVYKYMSNRIPIKTDEDGAAIVEYY